ncbi:unnamed protein product [Pedinophyceae sp. YPF-701]|nr:unnamed protein product [Pedinophyceae sp. YPF-701]
MRAAMQYSNAVRALPPAGRHAQALVRLRSSAPASAAKFAQRRPGTVWAAAAEAAEKQSKKGGGKKQGGNGNGAEAEVVQVPLPTSDESDQLLRIRHSSAHIMAMAVQRLFKDAQVTIGPWVERGFYYDFDIPTPLTDKELRKIQKEMRRICRLNLPFVREELSAEEARRRIEEINEPYKIEILDSILERDPDAPITIYHIGEQGDKNHWWDLCAGPHVESTGKINTDALKLESVAGAYWRGDESRQMLQRVYGTAWETAEQLAYYEHVKEEAKKRDHRKLGQELDLFSIQEAAGGGLVFWHPRGSLVRHIIESYWKDLHMSKGYDLLYSPHIAKTDLWHTSGHLQFYAESMFQRIQVEDESYQLKPMNCPFHVTTYKNGYRSYRQLPVRYAELGTVYRYEKSGTMHGLFRVRGFTQDDAHIFCLPEQIEGEIVGVLDLVEETLSTFGFSDYEINLSTRPEKSVGSDDIWERAEAGLTAALATKGWEYDIDEGGGAFYGPKIDIKILDAIGRKWQCSTIQLDFNLPERFDLEYVDEDNKKQRPIMIHRAIFGSIERFFGILTENYAGAFPLWLAPTQVRVLAVTDYQREYAEEVVAEFKKRGIRAEVAAGERIAKLIRNAETSKVPVMAVVGRKEEEARQVTLRGYKVGDIGTVGVDEAVAMVKDAEERKLVNVEPMPVAAEANGA